MKKTMKVLRKIHAKEGLWLDEAEIPTIGNDELLIKIHKTAICGTDIHIYNWDAWAQANVPLGLITGHEYAGEVVELGKDVHGFTVGDRVSGEGHLTCGHCRNCRGGTEHLCRNTDGIGVNVQGAFAEYLAQLVVLDELSNLPPSPVAVANRETRVGGGGRRRGRPPRGWCARSPWSRRRPVEAIGR
mgnify:CR=1 FL=1